MTRQEFILALRALDYDPRPYVGRGAQGRQCVGVVTGNPFNLGLDIGFNEGARDFIASYVASMDSAVCEVIVYWPGLEWPESEPDRDACDNIEEY
ncbi:MAG: hypothetical protein WC551_08750 [Patescibacteria group bacterium]